MKVGVDYQKEAVFVEAGDAGPVYLLDDAAGTIVDGLEAAQDDLPDDPDFDRFVRDMRAVVGDAGTDE